MTDRLKTEYLTSIKMSTQKCTTSCEGWWNFWVF